MRTLTREFPCRRHGFSLFEMTLVIFGMATLTLVGTAMMLGTFKAEKSAENGYLRLRSRIELADQFRADVARATEAPKSFDKLQAGPTCLILRDADGKHVIYLWKTTELHRREQNATGVAETLFPLEPNIRGVEFILSGANDRMVSLRLR